MKRLSFQFNLHLELLTTSNISQEHRDGTVVSILTGEEHKVAAQVR